MKAKMLCALMALLILVTPAPDGARAQSGGSYAMTWGTTAGVAVTSASGAYQVYGTVGQATMGEVRDTSPNGYALASGFWVVVQAWAAQFRTYLPLMIR